MFKEDSHSDSIKSMFIVPLGLKAHFYQCMWEVKRGTSKCQRNNVWNLQCAFRISLNILCICCCVCDWEDQKIFFFLERKTLLFVLAKSFRLLYTAIFLGKPDFVKAANTYNLLWSFQSYTKSVDICRLQTTHIKNNQKLLTLMFPFLQHICFVLLHASITL